MKNLENSVFKVNTANGSGTCFYLKQHNVFVTNYHVVEGFKQVCMENNNKDVFPGNVVMINPAQDLAFITSSQEINTDDLPINIVDVSLSQKVKVVGFPYGMPFSVTEGVVSSVNQLLEGRPHTQIDAAVNPGNSGGPVINDKGEIIGVVASKFTNADNMGFAIPASVLQKELEVVKDITDGFALKCSGCDTLIKASVKYCPDCGSQLEERYFDDYQLSKVGTFCEEAIAAIGMNPVLMRRGNEYWRGHHGSAEIRIFIYNSNYIYATSPVNNVPKKGLKPLFTFLLSNPLPPFQLGTSNNEIYLFYRFAVSDIDTSQRDTIKENLSKLLTHADDLDDKLQAEYGCEKTVFAKAV